MLLLGVAAAESLDCYAGHISGYLNTFSALGQLAWPQLYHADVWMRSDTMASLAREAVADANGFVWSGVFTKAISHTCAEAHTFWMREAFHPILLLSSRPPAGRKGDPSLYGGGKSKGKGAWRQPPPDSKGKAKGKGKKGEKGNTTGDVKKDTKPTKYR